LFFLPFGLPECFRHEDAARRTVNIRVRFVTFGHLFYRAIHITERIDIFAQIPRLLLRTHEVILIIIRPVWRLQKNSRRLQLVRRESDYAQRIFILRDGSQVHWNDLVYVTSGGEVVSAERPISSKILLHRGRDFPAMLVNIYFYNIAAAGHLVLFYQSSLGQVQRVPVFLLNRTERDKH